MNRLSSRGWGEGKVERTRKKFLLGSAAVVRPFQLGACSQATCRRIVCLEAKECFILHCLLFLAKHQTPDLVSTLLRSCPLMQTGVTLAG